MTGIGSRSARDRLRWLAAGIATGAAVIAVTATLQAVVDWPASLGPAAIASSVGPLIGIVAPQSRRLAGLGGRVLVQALSAGAFAILVSLVYLIVVRGLGNPPTAGAPAAARQRQPAGVRRPQRPR